MNGNYDLRPIWEITFKIYQEIDRICTRHGLRVFASSGTALGAIRHAGFIPWDDDFDVSMPWPDFIAFQKIAPKELPAWLKLLSCYNCSVYDYSFPKVIISDQKVLDEVCKASHSDAPQGIFVDIFALNGYPRSSVWKRVRYCVVGVSRMLMKHGFSKFWNYIMDYIVSRTPYETAESVIEWTGWFKREQQFIVNAKKWLTPAIFGNGKIVPFMDGAIRVPQDVDAYLKWTYGDYMTLPPEDRRRPGHVAISCERFPWRLGPVGT